MFGLERSARHARGPNLGAPLPTRRCPMPRVLRAAAAAVLLAPFAVGLGTTPVGATQHGPLFNHVSGVVSLDPNVARSTKGVSHVAAPVPLASTGGIACPDHSGTNDRVN